MIEYETMRRMKSERASITAACRSAIFRALARRGNDDGTVRGMSGPDHLLQDAESGSPSEFARIEQTVTPVALGLVSGWIAGQPASLSEAPEAALELERSPVVMEKEVTGRIRPTTLRAVPGPARPGSGWNWTGV